MSTDSKYPEMNKLAAASEDRDIILEFLNWCSATQGYHLGLYVDGRMAPVPRNTDDIVMDHLGIDYQELEAERRALLHEFRTHPLNGAPE